MSETVPPNGNPRIEPGFEFVYAATGRLGRPIVIGETPAGESRAIPILSGPVEGPRISGKLFAEGFDWQILRPDGVTVIDAQYALETSDSVIIQVRNRGLRRATVPGLDRPGASGTVDEPYFRCVPEFRAPAGRYGWLNESVFVCTGTRRENSVSLWVYRLI